jgi:hypothetical protein
VRASRRVAHASGACAFAEVNTPAQKDKAVVRQAKANATAPKLLSRVEALRLLSRVEEAGLLSLGARLRTARGCGASGRARAAGGAAAAPAPPPRYAVWLPAVARTEALHALLCALLPRAAAEKSGFTLSNIEKLGLLSKAERLGALSLATDRGTPGALTSTAVVLLAAAAAVVYFVPDTDTTLLVAQAVGAGVLGAAGIAAFVGGSFLGSLQK